jgi:hypothetical protein
MHGSFALVIAVLLGAGPETAKTPSRFEAMAQQLEFFQTGAFVQGSGHELAHRHPHVPDASIKSWLKANAELTSNRTPSAT